MLRIKTSLVSIPRLHFSQVAHHRGRIASDSYFKDLLKNTSSDPISRVLHHDRKANPLIKD